MILKGNIRAGGKELASHLLNATSNEKVTVAEVDGFAGHDLHGAFAEAEAIATGTNCTKPLYSLSINPSQQMSREDYGRAIDAIGDKLGLQGQPRAVVFHTKNGRDHCHVVWSRIDTENMQARHMAFDRQKLREVARELVLELGHKMPAHLGQDRFSDRFNERSDQPTLAEQGQIARSGLSPAHRREQVGQAFAVSDNARSFAHALQERGFVLAQGDKRGAVVVDMAGEIHSLTRQIEGVTAKQIRDKLDLSADELPTVQQAKEQVAQLTRHNALVATQERPDSPNRVEVAQDALTALTEAQRAEIKAHNGTHADRLSAIRTEERERIHHTREAIKQAFRPDWADLFRQQRAEQEAVKAQIASPARRLTALLRGKAGDAFDFANRGTLAGAFNFVVNGQADLSKLERIHKAQKKELGDTQRLAEKTEIGAIKAEVADMRRDARDDHQTQTRALKLAHVDELTKAVKALETARKLSERDGRDLSRGEVSRREKPMGFGFGKQGFERQGLAWRDREKERDDDEREREPKPPGRDFTP